jgi:hypothetical protein
MGSAHRGELHDAIEQERLIQIRKIGSTSSKELKRSVDIQRERVRTLYRINDSLRVDLDFLLFGEVFGHTVGSLELGGGGDIDQGHIRGKGRWVRRSQESLVHVLKRHCEIEEFE